MTDLPYKAKAHYQQTGVAQEYDQERFTSWHGRLAHATEANALQRVIRRYFERQGTLLDLPCGTGRLFPVLLSQGLQITGADISEEMMGVAKEQFAREACVRFQKANAEELPFADRSFDYLTSYRLMCHLPREVEKRVLCEMIRVTKKIAVINFHLTSWSPLYLFNQTFRKQFSPSSPLPKQELLQRLRSLPGVEVLEIKPLSWYELSSHLVVLKKKA